MKLIVAVDQNWGIGYKGELLQRIPEDMKFFKQLTDNHIIVMGKGTFESFPRREPLKNRVNIVLSKTLKDERVKLCRSLAELLLELETYNPDELYVIGGESIYNLLLPYCTEAYVTKIRHTYQADKYMKNIDQDETWKLVSESDLQNYQGIEYSFTKYIHEL